MCLSQGRIPSGDAKKVDPQLAMLELMSGVRDLLKEVAGGIHALPQEQKATQAAAILPPPKIRNPKILQGSILMGKSQSPASFVKDGKTDPVG
jgi:hypothetical protein